MGMAPDGLTEFDADLRRYEALLEMADLVVHHGSLPELFEELGGRLRGVPSFDFANFSLHDPRSNRMRLHVWNGDDRHSWPSDLEVDDTATGWVWENQHPLVLPDLEVENRFQ